MMSDSGSNDGITKESPRDREEERERVGEIHMRQAECTETP